MALVAALSNTNRGDTFENHLFASAIGFLSARHDRAGFDGENQAWEVAIEGGDPAAILTPGDWTNLSYRPDGVAHLVGLKNASDYPAPAGLYRVEDGRPVRLAVDLDRSVESAVPDGPQWLEDGSCRLVAEDRATLRIIEIAPDGSWRELLGGAGRHDHGDEPAARGPSQPWR